MDVSSRKVEPYGLVFVALILMCLLEQGSADGWDPTTQASNTESIINTRHNLTQSFSSNGAFMNVARNDYTEVCVYCHTPHGTNKQITAPLWNRTINTSSYQIYDKPTTNNQPIGQPGPNSLTCLSCHDGSISIDSVINMPGSGGYDSTQETVVNAAFLTTWNVSGNAGPNGSHFTLGPTGAPASCTFCHNKEIGGSIGAPDYTVFAIGTDLRNDHPVGIKFPTVTTAVDFNDPTEKQSGKLAFYDLDGDKFADKGEVRLYDSGSGFEVECGSCHDPHGVPTGEAGSEFIPSFLRVSNGNANTGEGEPSGLCLTCHLK